MESLSQFGYDPENALAVVTGAGKRLGRELALALGRQGYTVGIHYHRSHGGALDLQAELLEMNVRSLLLAGDLSESQDVDQLFAQVDESGIPLRVWINSAAIMPAANLDEMTVAAWDEVFNLNLRAAWLCSREAAQRMPDGGVIINITDTGASKLWTRYGAYALTKSALEMLTRLQAKTYAPRVRVNAVAPGLILPAEDQNPQEWQRLVDRLPLKRPGAPEYVCAAVEFLLQNEYITGQVIFVDGGYDLL